MNLPLRHDVRSLWVISNRWIDQSLAGRNPFTASANSLPHRRLIIFEDPQGAYRVVVILNFFYLA